MKLMQDAKTINRKLLRDSWESAQAAEPDLVIYHPKALGGAHIAEKLGIPAVLAVTAPVIVPTSIYPVVGMPNLKLGGWYNRLGYQLVNKGYTVYDGIANDFRHEVLGLEKMPRAALATQMPDGRPILVLHCISQHVLPRPQDWPDHAQLSGYWFLDQTDTWQAPAELQAFLDAGDAPVYVGFGSMAGRNPQRLAKIVIEALQQAQVRGIIASGWGGLEAGDLPESIYQITQAPHDWLFPRMAAVVHHGGAGTTAAGLRAGRPTIICPFIADQPFWGDRVQSLGVGSQPIPHKKLTAEKLAAAIREVTTSQSIRQNAAALGEKLRLEDGVATAIAMIEQYTAAREPA